MSATAAQVQQLRRMTDEPEGETYTDPTLTDYIERFPLDADNAEDATEFDLAAAAAQIWEEKAASLASDYDFSADGADYSRSQAHQHAMKMAKYYSGKRHARTITQEPEYPESASEEQPWIVNLAEDDT